jgi:hypothetical protein
MANALLSKKGIAIKAGDISVYNFDCTTGEYLSTSVEFLAIGVGIPANSCTESPGAPKKGFAICRNNDLERWEYIADHRGETIYNTLTAQPVKITVLGDYPAHMTTLTPSTPFDSWSGSEWIVNHDAKRNAQEQDAKQKKSALLASAKNTINLWQTELQLGIISDDDKKRLIAWIKYIQALQNVDTSLVPDVNWPEPPK